MNLEELKNETLKLVDEYNKDPRHRQLRPIYLYGEPIDKLRSYWTNWDDDNLSTHLVGFTYIIDIQHLHSVFDIEHPIPLEKATDDFKSQLAKIPLK